MVQHRVGPQQIFVGRMNWTLSWQIILKKTSTEVYLLTDEIQLSNLSEQLFYLRDCVKYTFAFKELII